MMGGSPRIRATFLFVFLLTPCRMIIHPRIAEVLLDLTWGLAELEPHTQIGPPPGRSGADASEVC